MESDPAIREQFGDDANVFLAYAQAVQLGQVQDDVLKSRVCFLDTEARENGFLSAATKRAYEAAVRPGMVEINRKPVLNP